LYLTLVDRAGLPNCPLQVALDVLCMLHSLAQPPDELGLC
jgi:hypothetical protein